MQLLNQVSRESQELSETVKNHSLPLLARVEAYEDIINLEVGDTGLSRARNIERESGLRQLYLKFEGGNPTGTQKDRIAFAQCHDALRRGFDTISLATCGNYGVSMALATTLAGLTCKIHIPENYHTGRVSEMQGSDIEVIRVKGDYENSIMSSTGQADKNGWYDANPGGQNTSLQVNAYAEIANEIYDQLREAPKVIATPVSNGTLMAGVYRGFVSLFKRGKTSRIPVMVAASSTRKNPIIQSFKKGLRKCMDLEPGQIHETVINEPLINWHSFDGDEALQALWETHGMAFNISDEKMIRNSRLLRDKEGLHVLPASVSSFVALLEMDNLKKFEPDRYVAILTSKK